MVPLWCSTICGNGGVWWGGQRIFYRVFGKSWPFLSQALFTWLVFSRPNTNTRIHITCVHSFQKRSGRSRWTILPCDTRFLVFLLQQKAVGGTYRLRPSEGRWTPHELSLLPNSISLPIVSSPVVLQLFLLDPPSGVHTHPSVISIALHWSFLLCVLPEHELNLPRL